MLPRGHRMASFWHLRMGRPAAVALVLLAAAAALQWHWLPQQQAERQRLQSRLMALPAARPDELQPIAVQAPVGLELPSQAQRAHDVEVLVDAAQRSGLQLERADYAMAAPNGNAAARLQATLPLTGTYGGLRRYVAAVLNELPHAALESLALERSDAQSTQLQATARLVLFYRAEQP
jgi:hypothetical protein